MLCCVVQCGVVWCCCVVVCCCVLLRVAVCCSLCAVCVCCVCAVCCYSCCVMLCRCVVCCGVVLCVAACCCCCFTTSSSRVWSRKRVGAAVTESNLHVPLPQALTPATPNPRRHTAKTACARGLQKKTRRELRIFQTYPHLIFDRWLVGW